MCRGGSTLGAATIFGLTITIARLCDVETSNEAPPHLVIRAEAAKAEALGGPE